jgi:hypothetical protein
VERCPCHTEDFVPEHDPMFQIIQSQPETQPVSVNRQGLQTCFWQPVELDVGDLPLTVDEGVCVHPEARHLSVVGWHADVVHQKRELHVPKEL